MTERVEDAAPAASPRPTTNGALVVALPLLLYAFIPRPPIGGAHYLTYPGMAAVLSVFVLLFFFKQSRVSSHLLVLLLLLLLLNAITAASFYVNVPELRIAALAELVRPAVFTVFLLFGYYAAAFCGGQVVKRGLVLAAQVILVGQLFIGLTQLMGLSVFDFIYSTEKTRGFGSLVRITGSMGNPNLFGWLVAQATVIAFHYAPRKNWLWLAIGVFLILTAGSRTLLLVFPFMIALVGVWRRGGGWSRYARAAALASAALAAIIVVIFSASQHLPYLAQLHGAILSGSLESVRSFAVRLDVWNLGYAEFSRNGPGAWLLGLGSRESTRVLDNDYLYVLFRLGWTGFVVHCVLFLYVAVLLRRRRESMAAVIGLQYLLFSLVLGLVYETLGGWLFPLLLFYLVGLSTGLAGRCPLSPASRDLVSRTPAGVRPVPA